MVGGCWRLVLLLRAPRGPRPPRRSLRSALLRSGSGLLAVGRCWCCPGRLAGLPSFDGLRMVLGRDVLSLSAEEEYSFRSAHWLPRRRTSRNDRLGCVWSTTPVVWPFVRPGVWCSRRRCGGPSRCRSRLRRRRCRVLLLRSGRFRRGVGRPS